MDNIHLDRKARHWEHPTDVRSNENLVYWVQELREWLADERTQSLKQEYFLPFAEAVAICDQIPPGAEVHEICQVIETLLEANDALESYTYDLAERALGQWGAYFFMANHDEVRPDLEYDARALEHIAILHSATATRTEPFVPTPFQAEILKALNSRALNKQKLAAVVCGGEENGNLLYRPNRLPELRSRGLVEHKRGLGFYRPDAPPPGAIAGE